jgi:hypothetical protein
MNRFQLVELMRLRKLVRRLKVRCSQVHGRLDFVHPKLAGARNFE